MLMQNTVAAPEFFFLGGTGEKGGKMTIWGGNFAYFALFSILLGGKWGWAKVPTGGKMAPLGAANGNIARILGVELSFWCLKCSRDNIFVILQVNIKLRLPFYYLLQTSNLLLPLSENAIFLLHIIILL